MSDYVIETKGLTRYYGEFCALNQIDLAIEKGRMVALLGPNGAGKTTMLHLLAGMLEPTAGCALIGGVNTRQRVNSGSAMVGYMSDIDNPPAWMTGGQMIELQAGVGPAFDRKYALKLITDKELSPGKPYGTMSKGQKKWLKAALVLASKPEVIIMDEPADGLDPQARYDLYDYLKEYIIDTGATAIIATHIIGDIERIADDVAIIDHGRVLTHASLEDLRDEVYEVYMPGSSQTLPAVEDVKILGQRTTPEGTILWLQGSPAKIENIKKQSAPTVTITHVDLQTYYMAITGKYSEGSKL